MRLAAVVLVSLLLSAAGIGAAVAVTESTSVLSVCANVSTPVQTISANGVRVGTIGAKSAQACTTTTVTVPTSTVTSTLLSTTTVFSTTVPATTTDTVPTTTTTTTTPPLQSDCTTTLNAGANLTTAITAAASGATLCLQAGSYPAFNMYNVDHTSDVNIVPVAGATVSIGGMNLGSDDHLNFDGTGGTMSIAGFDNDTADVTPDPSKFWTFRHITWTGGIGLRVHTTDQHILFDSDTFYNLQGGGGWEGRLTVRGYDNTGPVGVVVTNSKFGNGGCSDGMQIIGGAYGVVVGPNNEFSGFDQGSCAAHVDPIQFYGADRTVITGDFFHDNGNSTGGVESFDGLGEHATVTNNVIVRTPGGYPWSIAASYAVGWLIQHNTIAGGGMVDIGEIVATDHGNIVRDNVFAGGGGLSIDPGYGSNDHNLNAGIPGDGNVNGAPVFAGGASPSTYADYRLAGGSPGEGAASDGTDIGIG